MNMVHLPKVMLINKLQYYLSQNNLTSLNKIGYSEISIYIFLFKGAFVYFISKMVYLRHWNCLRKTILYI